MVPGYGFNAIPSLLVVPVEMVKGKGINPTMEGMRSIYNISIQVLLNTGASHSFIASDLIDWLSLKPKKVKDPLVVYNLLTGSDLGEKLASPDYMFV